MRSYHCLHCLEPVDQAEPHREINGGADRAHLECLLRMTIGSLAHQQKRCSCFGGTDNGDPPGLTARQAARAAACFFTHGTSAVKDNRP